MNTSEGWRSRIVGHAEVPPTELTANPRNWRKHPKAQQDALADVLDRVGWVQDVIVNQRTGLLVDGHARIELALRRGEASVPVVYVDLAPDEETLVLATLDPLSAMAEADQEALDSLLAEVVADGELARMLDELADAPKEPKAGNTDPDDVPDVPEQSYVQRGDIYQLGAHRLMCGDSTNTEDVARLLDGSSPALMVTDPPYGVSYDPSWRAEAGVNKNTGKLGKVANDDRADWREAWALSPARVAYVWHDALHARTVEESLTAEGYEVRSQIVWVKDRLVLSRGHYHWRHEPCLYVVRNGSSADWLGGRSQTTVWEIPSRDDAGHGHGTQKPVEAMERPIRNHKGDVYEPFAGSGTTLIAAERLGRCCYGMEIEPKYVQIAITRWEQYTGEKAVKINAS